MTLIESVYHSLKRKKSAAAEAQRLNISIPQYNLLKQDIFRIIRDVEPQVDSAIVKILNDTILTGSSDTTVNIDSFTGVTPDAGAEDSKRTEIHENMEAGTAKITGVASIEPRSAEEIIQVLKIDTTLWKLSQYWNKEKGDKWIVSALVTRVAQVQVDQYNFLELLEQYSIPEITPLTPSTLYLNTESDEKVCGVLSLQDLHFGKVNNEDMGEILNQSVEYLIGKAHKNYHLEKILFVIGPDTLNMDTFGGTTTKGTPVENSSSATDAYLTAFDAICKAIVTTKDFCEELEIVFIPGNHDRLSSFHLLHAVSLAFKAWPGITFNVDYAERKVITYGQNMLCLEHGDVSAKNNPLVYAVEFPSEWGSCTHRILYTGHYHGRKTKEFITENEEHGFVSRIIPALTSSDYYHHHNKYTGNKRSALLHLHHEDKGLVSEFVYTV